MKTFKITITVILAVAGIVCLCFGHNFLGCIVFGTAIAVWMPKDGGNHGSKGGGSISSTEQAYLMYGDM